MTKTYQTVIEAEAAWTKIKAHNDVETMTYSQFDAQCRAIFGRIPTVTRGLLFDDWQDFAGAVAVIAEKDMLG